jgi:hypothetical protein
LTRANRLQKVAYFPQSYPGSARGSSTAPRITLTRMNLQFTGNGGNLTMTNNIGTGNEQFFRLHLAN